VKNAIARTAPDFNWGVAGAVVEETILAQPPGEAVTGVHRESMAGDLASGRKGF